MTILFTLFIICHLFNAFNSKKLQIESLTEYGMRNKKMNVIVIITLLIQVMITQLGESVFHTTPLGLEIWYKILGMGIVVLLVDEVRRYVQRNVKKWWLR